MRKYSRAECKASAFAWRAPSTTNSPEAAASSLTVTMRAPFARHAPFASRSVTSCSMLASTRMLYARRCSSPASSTLVPPPHGSAASAAPANSPSELERHARAGARRPPSKRPSSRRGPGCCGLALSGTGRLMSTMCRGVVDDRCVGRGAGFDSRRLHYFSSCFDAGPWNQHAPLPLGCRSRMPGERHGRPGARSPAGPPRGPGACI